MILRDLCKEEIKIWVKFKEKAFINKSCFIFIGNEWCKILCPSLKKRNDTKVNYFYMYRELFAYKGDEFFKNIHFRFHQKDVWFPYAPRYLFMFIETTRNILPYKLQYFSTFSNSYDHYNIWIVSNNKIFKQYI